jgi:acyl-coenzyme A thioesterase PaaI-like protein
VPLIHHELCFGCGRTNLFGLLLDAEQTGPGDVAGRAFIKQDHQGWEPGSAHAGLVATALAEAMAFAAGPDATLRSLSVDTGTTAPVGGFLDVEAHVERRQPGTVHVTARARADGEVVATAQATFSG